MRRLTEVILFTPDLARMRRFYERHVGLSPRLADPHWTTYPTRGATLALHPVDPGADPHVELVFGDGDLDAAVSVLAERGVALEGPIREAEWGRIAHFRDPSGLRLGLEQPRRPHEAGTALPIGVAIVNPSDHGETKAFYHEALGLPVVIDSPGWLHFDSGEAWLAVHTRRRWSGSPDPRRDQVLVALGVARFEEWIDEARGRGLDLSGPVAERGLGRFMTSVDPDGNEIAFREQMDEATLEATLEDSIEENGIPRIAGFHRPLRKASRAVTVSVRNAAPAEKPRSTARRRPSATTRTVAKVRGGGPGRTRLTPKRTADEKKAKVKPAMGRLKKAQGVRAEVHKRETAGSSKGKPVKRAASKPVRRGRRSAR